MVQVLFTLHYYIHLIDLRLQKQLVMKLNHFYGSEAVELWKDENIELHLEDFTHALPPNRDEQKWNLLICNPPYVRHHHLSSTEKPLLQSLGKQATGIKLSMQAGLYGYFLLISHSWLMDGGLAVWLIPSEFMDVNYGKKIREYLLTKVSLLSIHRFAPDSVQFDDALVSSAIVCFKKTHPVADQTIDFTYGGTLLKPHVLKKINLNTLTNANKWNKIFLEENSVDQITDQYDTISSAKALNKVNFDVAGHKKMKQCI